MALRVLLADNSETIKKVITLTLQDYAVDLRIVSSGLDVMDVVAKFKPEIIFVDILLQKKSGYDVAREIKQHPTLGSIPVILMWSGFMEFDEEKAKGSLADARLEKPFDAKTLRELVQRFVAKTKTNPLSSFLEFPEMPPLQDQVPPRPSKKISDPLQDLEKIKQESLKFAPQNTIETKTDIEKTKLDLSQDLPTLDLDVEAGGEEFEMKPLSQSAAPSLNVDPGSFKLDLPDDVTGDDFSVDAGSVEKIEDMSFLLNPEATKRDVPQTVRPATQPAAPIQSHPIVQAAAQTQKVPSQESVKHGASNISQSEIEKIVNEKVQEIIEKVVWQVVPEVASQLIRKELERLLKDNDSNP